MGVLCSLGFGGLHEGSELTTDFRQVSSVPWVSVWRAQRQSPFGRPLRRKEVLGVALGPQRVPTNGVADDIGVLCR